MSAREVAALDQLVDQGRYRSRTEAIRDAVGRLLKELAEQELVESHRLAYADDDPSDTSVVRRSRRAVRALIEEDQ
jgi:Arc/MetJ-type ribon-helix-helix transcriptional regulator